LGDLEKKASVVIACRNELKYIKACIESVLDNDYPKDALEIIVVDGMSDDGSRKIIEEEKVKFSNIKMVDNEQKLTPFAFNLGIKNATGEYLIIMGGRHNISKNYISTCINILKSDLKIACVGGKVENIFENNISNLIATAMASPFGVGGGNFRVKDEDGFVDTVGTPVFRKSVFDEVGFFDETLARNQDDEFSFRLTKLGYKIFFTVKAGVRYYVRASFSNLFRQYYQYGYWKVFVNKKHKSITTMRQLAPIGLILFLLLGGIASMFNNLIVVTYLSVLLLYILITLGAAAISCKHLADLPMIAFAIFTLHISYGLGYLQGIIHFILLGKMPSTKQTTLSR
jgi:GT2 family glycosyltransferase